jgi:hypothetical protein
MMSACFAALANMMAFYITYTIISRNPSAKTQNAERVLYPVVSMAVALTFAFSLAHWRHALMAEVYSLNAFLCGLIMLLLLKWHGSARSGAPKDWPLYVAALVFGLGFGNHQTISLVSVAAVFLLLVTDWRILLRWKSLLLIVVCLGLGLSVYVQVPLSARTKPPVNWGNPVTWRQFKWLVTREGYQHVERGHAVRKLWQALTGRQDVADEAAEEPPTVTGEPTAVAQERTAAVAGERPGETSEEEQVVVEAETPSSSSIDIFFNSLFFRQLATFNPVREFGYLGLMLALAGIGYGLVAPRIPTITLVLAMLTLLIFILLIGDPPDENVFLVEEFHTPGYLFFSVLVGIGMIAIVRGVLWVAVGGQLIQYGAAVIMAAAFVVLPATQMLGHVKMVDRSRNYVAYDYGWNILDSLQPNAILFTWGDSGAFPLWYLQYVEGVRPDVTLIHVPHLGTRWFVDDLPPELFFTDDPFTVFEGDLLLLIDDIVHKNVLDRPIYFDYSSLHALPIPYDILPHGLAYKVALPGETFDETVWQRYRFRGLMSFSLSERDLERLHQEAQITEDIATPLKPLVNRVFASQEAFLQAVERLIGAASTHKYQEFLLIHALFRPTIAHDPDIDRTFLMYGSARVELGHFYMERGELEKAAAEFNAAVRFDASLGDGIVRILQFNDKLGGRGLRESE